MGKKRSRTRDPGKTQEERRQDQRTVTGEVPKPRRIELALLRQRSGAGPHGTTGYTRHPKHKRRINHDD